MPSTTDPSNPPSLDVELDVRGTVPPGLSGRLVGIGRDGVVHSVPVGGGRVSYRSHRFGVDVSLHHLVAFGDSILAFGDDSSAFELSADIDTLSRVDLAGRGRVLAAHPQHDPSTGELHLIARAADGMHAHVVVSAGALTRRSRPILDVPSCIKCLALTRERIILVADGFVGVASRDGEARTTWITTGVAAPHPVHARDAGDAVELLALTASLERWTVHAGAATVEREDLDPTPGDLVFVPDEAAGDTAGGWLVGFVHDASSAQTEFRVIDAAEIAVPAVATAFIPRRIPLELRCTWIPATQH